MRSSRGHGKLWKVLKSKESSGGHGKFWRAGKVLQARKVLRGKGGSGGGKDTDVFACPVLVQGLALSAQRII